MGDQKKKKVEAEPKSEGMTRRELLEKSGRYSLAVMGVVLGGRALTGCSDKDGFLCTNTCSYANDNECDDGGPDAAYNECALGTDCNDCGVRGTSSRWGEPTGSYSDGYGDYYSDGYYDYYSDYYSDYYNYYSDYYSDYYNYYSNYSDYYSDYYNYYSNYYSNSW
jgi:hypothetical protein